MSNFEDPSTRDDDVTARARQRIGRILKGKWQLDSLLGVGGMASVYAATHRNGKRGAVKMLHLELSTSAEVRQRFLREGYVANKVDHSGAVSVLDDDITETGEVFIVMELLEGESLEGAAKKRPGKRFEIGELVAVGIALCDVLAAAHDKGIVHRDLKPDNLFVTRRGELKVLDFGIARLKEAGSSSSVTKTGAALGTPSFMPPEQALGEWTKVDGQSDVWAVGATLFTLATGRVVHEAETLNKLLLAAMTSKAPTLASIDRGLPASLCAIVDKALAFDKNDRWPDARAMQQALQNFAPYAGRVALASISAPPPAWAAEMALAETQSVRDFEQLASSASSLASPPSSRAMSAPQPLASGAQPLSSAGGTWQSQPSRSDPLRSVSTTVPVSSEPLPMNKRSTAGAIVLGVGLVVALGGAAAAYLVLSRGTKVDAITTAPDVSSSHAAASSTTDAPAITPIASASVSPSADVGVSPPAAESTGAPSAAPRGRSPVAKPAPLPPPASSSKAKKTDAFGDY